MPWNLHVSSCKVVGKRQKTNTILLVFLEYWSVIKVTIIMNYYTCNYACAQKPKIRYIYIEEVRYWFKYAIVWLYGIRMYAIV